MSEDNQARAETIELIYNTYKDCLDLDIAFTLAGVNFDERILLEQDEILLARIAVWDAKVKQDLIMRLRKLMTESQSDAVQLQALKELGKTFYSKRFKDIPLIDAEGLIHLGVPGFVKGKAVPEVANEN